MNPDYLLGIEAIDRQHEELFSRMDLLLTTCMSKNCSAEVENMLDFLDSYVATHFAAEEGLQQAAIYPGYKDHVRKHADFISNIAFIRAVITEKGISDSVIQHINQMLIDWFGKHILEQDRAMSDYLRTTSRM